MTWAYAWLRVLVYNSQLLLITSYGLVTGAAVSLYLLYALHFKAAITDNLLAVCILSGVLCTFTALLAPWVAICRALKAALLNISIITSVFFLWLAVLPLLLPFAYLLAADFLSGVLLVWFLMRYAMRVAQKNGCEPLTVCTLHTLQMVSMSVLVVWQVLIVKAI